MQVTDEGQRLRELEMRVDELEAALTRLTLESLGALLPPGAYSEGAADLETELNSWRSGFRIQ